MNTAARQTSLLNIQVVPDRVPPADKNQQFTPGYIADFARSVFGKGIELDPTSSPIANEVIQADRFFTEEQDGLIQDWTADTLFFNPPYGAGLIGPMIAKFLEELPRINQAIVLVNSSTNVEWYQSLIQRQDRMLMPGHRIQFWTAEGLPSDPTSRAAYQAKPKGNNRFAQTIFYFGPNVDRFDALAADLGYPLATAEATHGKTVKSPCVTLPKTVTHGKPADFPCVEQLESIADSLLDRINQLRTEGVAFGSLSSAVRSGGTGTQAYFYPIGGGRPEYVPVAAVEAKTADVDRGRQVRRLEAKIAAIETARRLFLED